MGLQVPGHLFDAADGILKHEEHSHALQNTPGITVLVCLSNCTDDEVEQFL